jgi:hypothetical protein
MLKKQSVINILRNAFICGVLAIASIIFSRDSQKLVLDPLERMIEKVRVISENPMSAASESINTAGIYSFADSISKKRSIRRAKTSRIIEEKTQVEYESETLEKAIVKIGSLLALGFGEAGAGIIG